MQRVRSLALLVSLWMSACTFDFTDISDIPEDIPAALHVQILTSTRTDQLRVSATLNPGRGSDAIVRTVMTDLMVAGRPIAPSTAALDEAFRYDAEWSLSAELPAGGAVVIRAPEIEGVQAGAQTFEVAVPSRLGPDTLLANGGEAVVLHIPSAAVAPVSAHWQLNVTDATGIRHFSIQSVGFPPEQIILPRSWFSSAASVYDLDLRISQYFSSELVPGSYVWAASVHAQLHSTVVLSGDT